MSWNHDEISEEAYRVACEACGVDPDEYDYGTDPTIEALAYDEEVQRQVMRAEASWEGDR